MNIPSIGLTSDELHQVTHYRSSKQQCSLSSNQDRIMAPQNRAKQNEALPKYWRHRGKTYYYRVPPHMRHLHSGKAEISLGQSLSQAYQKFAGL
jgi:hypothetical protein